MTIIPLVDLRAQHAAVAENVAIGWQQVLDGTAFINGPQVATFECEYAAYIGTRHCLGVANGTDAIRSHCAHSASARRRVHPAREHLHCDCRGSLPGRSHAVLVDCADDDTYLMDIDAVATAINSRTRAIIPVHLYGQAAPVELLLPLAERVGAWVVEDAAQSQGARRNGMRAGAPRMLQPLAFTLARTSAPTVMLGPCSPTLTYRRSECA